MRPTPLVRVATQTLGETLGGCRPCLRPTRCMFSWAASTYSAHTSSAASSSMRSAVRHGVPSSSSTRVVCSTNSSVNVSFITGVVRNKLLGSTIARPVSLWIDASGPTSSRVVVSGPMSITSPRVPPTSMRSPSRNDRADTRRKVPLRQRMSSLVAMTSAAASAARLRATVCSCSAHNTTVLARNSTTAVLRDCTKKRLRRSGGSPELSNVRTAMRRPATISRRMPTLTSTLTADGCSPSFASSSIGAA